MKGAGITLLLLLILSLGSQAQDQPDRPDRTIEIRKIVETHRARTQKRQLSIKTISRPALRVNGTAKGASLSGIVHGMLPGAYGDVLLESATSGGDEDSTTTVLAVGVKEDGHYQFEDVPAGTYLLSVSAEGHALQYYESARSADEATRIEVGDESIEGLDFFLDELVRGTGAIAGLVLDAESGEPLIDADVIAVPIDNYDYQSWTRTGPDGAYRLEGLGSGDYFVVAMAQGYIFVAYENTRLEEEAKPVTVVEPETTEGINFSLSKGAVLTGTVLDADADPVSGVTMLATPLLWYTPSAEDSSISNLTEGWATTDDQGNYELGGLLAGEYVLSAQYYTPFAYVHKFYEDADDFSDATIVSVEDAGRVDNLNMSLDVNFETGTIAGSVISPVSEEHLEGWVFVINETGSAAGYFGAPLNPDGSFTLEVPEGAYKVGAETWSHEFASATFYPSTPFESEAEVVQVVEDEVVRIEIVVPVYEGEVTGTVRDQDGDGVAGASIQLEPAAGQEYFGHLYATSDESGNYVVSRVPDGLYKAVAFVCGPWQCSQAWWPSNDEFGEGAEILTVENGVVTGGSIDFQVQNVIGSASISGRVTNTSGEPLPGASIMLSSGGNADSAWVFGGWGSTDENGDYVVSGLFEGSWFVQVNHWDEEGFASGWYDGAARIEDATPVVVTENDYIQNIDFSVEVAPFWGSIGGQVTIGGGGTPAARGYVEVMPSFEDIRYDDFVYYEPTWAELKEDGSFQVERISRGRYTVTVYGQTGVAMLTEVEVVGGEDSLVRLDIQERNAGPAAISGTITDFDNVPIDLAVVQAWSVDEPLTEPFSTVANPDGSYTLSGLPEGRYYVNAFRGWFSAMFYGGSYDAESAAIVSVSGAEPASGIDIQLDGIAYLAFADAGGIANESSSSRSGSTLSVFGSVSSADGASISDASVYVLNGAGESVAQGRTDANGKYEITRVPASLEYTLMATRPGFETGYSGNTSSKEDAESIKPVSNRIELNFELQSAVATDRDDRELPTDVTLDGNYPNPFNPTTNIAFTLPTSTNVRLVVFDMLGRPVATLVDRELSAGSHSIRFTTDDIATSGVFMYRLTTPAGTQTRKMTLLR